MITPATVVLSVLPIYLLLLGGAVFRKIGILRAEDDAGVMKVIFSLMLPCFILDRMLGVEVLQDPAVLLTGIGLGFFFICLGIVLGYISGRLIRLERGHGIRTFALSSGIQNYGFTAIPVVEILWGSSAVAVLFVHNIGVELALWSFGVMLISGERRICWKRLINGPIVAVALGLILVATHLDVYVTGPARTAISMAGVGAFPLAIIITGASIVDFLGKEKFSARVVTAACIVRLLILPAVIICSAKFIPMAPELRQVLLVQAAMPAALVPILLARLYGGRPAVAVQIVVATTFVSLLTLPYIITYGIRFLDLIPITP